MLCRPCISCESTSLCATTSPVLVQTSCAKHFVQACADVTRYALWTGMCGSHVLCKLPCGNHHGSGVQKHVCGNMAWMRQRCCSFQSQNIYIFTRMSMLQWKYKLKAPGDSKIAVLHWGDVLVLCRQCGGCQGSCESQC